MVSLFEDLAGEVEKLVKFVFVLEVKLVDDKVSPISCREAQAEEACSDRLKQLDIGMVAILDGKT